MTLDLLKKKKKKKVRGTKQIPEHYRKHKTRILWQVKERRQIN